MKRTLRALLVAMLVAVGVVAVETPAMAWSCAETDASYCRDDGWGPFSTGSGSTINCGAWHYRQSEVRIRACSWHYQTKYRVGFQVQNYGDVCQWASLAGSAYRANQNGSGLAFQWTPDANHNLWGQATSIIVCANQVETVWAVRYGFAQHLCVGIDGGEIEPGGGAWYMRMRSPMQHGYSAGTNCTNPPGWNPAA